MSDFMSNGFAIFFVIFLVLIIAFMVGCHSGNGANWRWFAFLIVLLLVIGLVWWSGGY